MQRTAFLKTSPFPVEDTSLTGMFSFLNGDPVRTHKMIESGELPWWTFESVRLSFLRPFTECTHLLDYTLWPDSPYLMHIHSLFWLGVLVFVVTLMYRKTMGAVWYAGLAALFYAIDDVHALPAAWLANRNALLAAVFGVLALLAHDKWRREGWRPGIVLAPLCLLLGLSSAETSIAAFAYIVAYEITLGSGGIRHKIAGIVPHAVICLSWLFLYHASNFGAYGSGFYVEPIRNPLLFLEIVINRMPILLLGQWLWAAADIYHLLPETQAWILWTFACIFLALLVVLLIPLLKRDAMARFWALAMMLAVIPICIPLPASRLLIFVGLGAMGLLAQFLFTWFERPHWLPKSRLWRGLGTVYVYIFLVAHLVLAPITLSLTAIDHAKMAESLVDSPITRLYNDYDVVEKTIVFLNPPFSFFAVSVRSFAQYKGLRFPKNYRVITSGWPPHRIRLRRTAARAIEIEPELGFYSLQWDRLFRGLAYPMKIGQQVLLSNMKAEVLSLTEDKRPFRVLFTFPNDLNDPSLLFLKWKHDHFERFEMPKIGETSILDKIQLPL